MERKIGYLNSPISNLSPKPKPILKRNPRTGTTATDSRILVTLPAPSRHPPASLPRLPPASLPQSPPAPPPGPPSAPPRPHPCHCRGPRPELMSRRDSWGEHGGQRWHRGVGRKRKEGASIWVALVRLHLWVVAPLLRGANRSLLGVIC